MRQLPALLSLGLTFATSQAATIVIGDVTANLGPDFFFDTAAVGGGDFGVNQPGSATFDRSFGTLNVGTGGSDVIISGIGWATLNNAAQNDATSATVTITYLGQDGAFGGGDDVVIGSITDNFTFATNGEYYWKFDTPVSTTIDGTNNLFRVSIAPSNDLSTGSLSFKSANSPNNTAANVKLSIAGSSVAVVPEPATALLGGLGLLGLLHRRR